MRLIENQLYRAFNASYELSSGSALNWMTGGGNNDGLSRTERLASDSQMLHQLQNKLSDRDFRVLRLYFTTTVDVDGTRIIFSPIRPALIKESKIVRTVDTQFVDLVAISEFWQKNILGHLSNYGSQFTNCRRRKRIILVLNDWRLQALRQAANIISLSYISESSENFSAIA